MGNIVLSSGVRSNLLELQRTGDLIGLTQIRLSTGKRPDQKRAVVTLAEGDTIEIFEAKGP